MTFSTLSYLVWYKKYRRFIKDLIDFNDFVTAQTMLEDLILEHQSNMPLDHSVMESELGHMKHALKHIKQTNASSSDFEKQRLTRILEYEPQQHDEA